MAGVYLLWHSYELENGCEETKMLGVFFSEEKAREATALRRNGTEQEGGPLCH